MMDILKSRAVLDLGHFFFMSTDDLFNLTECLVFGCISFRMSINIKLRILSLWHKESIILYKTPRPIVTPEKRS